MERYLGYWKCPVHVLLRTEEAATKKIVPRLSGLQFPRGVEIWGTVDGPISQSLNKALSHSSQLRVLNLDSVEQSPQVSKNLASIIRQNGAHLRQINFSCKEQDFGLSEFGGRILGQLQSCSQLEDLKLTKVSLSYEVKTLLCRSLSSSCQTIRTLCLEESLLDGLRDLADLLPKCPRLENLTIFEVCSLDMQLPPGFDYGFWEADASYFSDALAQCTCLEQLVLDFLEIGPVAVSKLCPGIEQLTGLKGLDLSGNAIAGPAVDDVMEMLPKLTNLNTLTLACNEFLDDGAVKLASVIKALPKLQHFNYGSTGATDEGITTLAQGLSECTMLEDLQIGGHDHLSLVGVSQVAGVLMNCCVKRETLHEFNFEFGPLGNQGVALFMETLCLCKTLKTLNLSECQIGNPGAYHLSTLLRKTRCRELKSLYLHRNAISYRGAHQIITKTKNCPALTYIGLDENPLDAKDVEKLFKILDSYRDRGLVEEATVSMKEWDESSRIIGLDLQP